MIHEDLTRQIIGCAYRIHNVMGFGYLESVYQKCLEVEFAESGLPAKREASLGVAYRGRTVGEFIADFLVADLVIVEIKSVRKLAVAHEAQLVNYLAATGIDAGLLINFGATQVEVKRKFRIYRTRQSTNPENPVILSE